MNALLIDLGASGKLELGAIVTQQLLGEPFLFLRESYGGEITLHFGSLVTYSLPRFGERQRGSHVLSLRAASWVIKPGPFPVVIANAPVNTPDFGERRVTSEDLAKLFAKPSKVTSAEVFEHEVVPGYGLQVRLSDGTLITVYPSEVGKEADDEGLPPLNDWTITSPWASVTCGPGKAYEVALGQAKQ